MRDMVQIRRGARKSYEGPDAKIGRSQFNRSHGLKMSFDASFLYPIFLDEVLPGDTMTMSLNGFARIFSPLDAPVMDNIELETFFFFVPTRLLWDNWAYFNGEHDAKGIQDTTYTIPVIASGLTVDHDNVLTGHGLAAYLGLPHGLTSAGVTDVSALPFRAYNLIFGEWFRDQNTADHTMGSTGNGPDAISIFGIYSSAKKHDYFTSALPYLQKGTALTTAVIPSTAAGLEYPTWKSEGGGGTALGWQDYFVGTADPQIVQTRSDVGSGAPATGDEKWWDQPNLSVDINALRQSVAIQRLLERDARGGTRYVEIIKTHFGVTSPDYRLQRPEYLGGGKSFINISPVANTSGVDAAAGPGTLDIHQGALVGIGTGVIQGHSWAKSFTEHGYLMGIIRARGDITYFQGIDKLFTRSTRYDFYIPALANLGEQSVLNQEIFVSNSTAIDKAVFAYQERWAEYRMKNSRVAGVFNPDVTGSLSHWHLAEDFASLPTMAFQFIYDETPMARITTVDTEPDFLLDLWFNYKCARPMPVYSIPGLVTRF